MQRRVRTWWLLLPLAVLTWALVHASGVHATVAGVLLAFAVPVVRSDAAGGPDAGPGLAEHFEHRFRPLSAGVAVPVFAFFSAGVTIGGLPGSAHALSDPVALGIVAGLVVGQDDRASAAPPGWSPGSPAPRLDEDLGWPDVVGLSLLGGIGFTVSLLIGELAFGMGSRPRRARQGRRPDRHRCWPRCWPRVVLRLRNRRYQRIARQEELDADADGVPDVFQDPAPPGGLAGAGG